MKRSEAAFEATLEEAVRLSCFNVLTWATRVLPRKLLLRAADACGLLVSMLPRRWYSTYSEMHKAFNVGGRASFRMAQAWLARPFRDFVVLSRILHGLESPKDWKIIERNSDGIEALRQSGESYLLATGHFTRYPMMALFQKKITPGRIVQVTNAVPSLKGTLKDRRIRIQLGTPINAAKGERPEDLDFFIVGSGFGAVRKLCNYLRKPGHVVFIHIDAPWSSDFAGSFERAFAADKNRTFATGAAVLSRLSDCPIITCIAYCENDETIVLDWGVPIRPPSSKGGNSEITVLNGLFDKLELAIGMRPSQYILPLGTGRKWNAASRLWEVRDD